MILVKTPLGLRTVWERMTDEDKIASRLAPVELLEDAETDRGMLESEVVEDLRRRLDGARKAFFVACEETAAVVNERDAATRERDSARIERDNARVVRNGWRKRAEQAEKGLAEFRAPLPEHKPNFLGKIVRDVWVQWAAEQDSPKPSWLVPWEDLKEFDREADRRIGVRVAEVATAWTLEEMTILRNDLGAAIARAEKAEKERDAVQLRADQSEGIAAHLRVECDGLFHERSRYRAEMELVKSAKIKEWSNASMTFQDRLPEVLVHDLHVVNKECTNFTMTISGVRVADYKNKAEAGMIADALRKAMAAEAARKAEDLSPRRSILDGLMPRTVFDDASPKSEPVDWVSERRCNREKQDILDEARAKIEGLDRRIEHLRSILISTVCASGGAGCSDKVGDDFLAGVPAEVRRLRERLEAATLERDTARDVLNGAKVGPANGLLADRIEMLLSSLRRVHTLLREKSQEMEP